MGRGTCWVPFIRILRALDLVDGDYMVSQSELQAIVGIEATQKMRFATENNGFRDMVGIRADCIDAALTGWSRLPQQTPRAQAVAAINNFFDIVQKDLRPMLDITPANNPDTNGEAAFMRGAYAAVAEAKEEPEGDPVPVDVQTFESPFGKARVVVFSDGTPWFVAKDVCEGLGFKGTPKDHVGRLEPEQVQVLRVRRVSNQSHKFELFGLKAQALTLITRGGFNDLILESRKPVAREYRQWVTDKVLPALQDTGTFTDENHPATLRGNNPRLVITDEGQKIEVQPTPEQFPLSEDDILKWAGKIVETRLAEKRAELEAAIAKDQKARFGLKMVADGEDVTMQGWVLYGEALLEGRKLFTGDREFGRWVKDNVLSQLAIAPDDQAAAIWAAEDRDRLTATLKAHPRVRTVRGLHAKWKEAERPQPTPLFETRGLPPSDTLTGDEGDGNISPQNCERRR